MPQITKISKQYNIITFIIDLHEVQTDSLTHSLTHFPRSESRSKLPMVAAKEHLKNVVDTGRYYGKYCLYYTVTVRK